MIELSLTIEIYIAGVKNRAGFATVLQTGIFQKLHEFPARVE